MDSAVCGDRRATLLCGFFGVASSDYGLIVDRAGESSFRRKFTTYFDCGHNSNAVSGV